MDQHVELDRQFRSLSPDEEAEQAAIASYTAGFLGKDEGTGWSDVLSRYRVVILGEPGSGKTHELRFRASELRKNGSHAFSVDLSALIGEQLPSALGGDEFKKLRRWLRSGDEGFFFLDSVDEAKWHHPKDFSAALRHFRDTLGGSALNRAHVIFSSRISEWQPHVDEGETLRLLPLPPSPKGRSGQQDDDNCDGCEPLLVVQLQPLDRQQVHS